MNIYVDGISKIIPSSWHDISLSEYLSASDAYSLCEILGLPPVELVLHYLSFLEEPIPAIDLPTDIAAIDILDQTWGKNEQAKRAANEHEDEQLAFCSYVSVYVGFDVSILPVPDALCILEHFRTQLDQIHSAYGHIDFSRFETEKEAIARAMCEGGDPFAGLSIESQMKAMGYKPHEYEHMLNTISLYAVLQEKLYAYRVAEYQYHIDKISRQSKN